MPQSNAPSPEILEKRQDATKEKIANDVFIKNHFILHVKDLPFEGQPEVLTDEHKSRLLQFFEQLIVEGYQPKISSISGYASSPGEEKFNDQLSQRRVEVIDEFLQKIKDDSNVPEVNSYNLFYPHYNTEPFGESRATDDSDSAIDRRVEIAYSIFKKLPLEYDPGRPGTIPRSKNWKIDFGGATNAAYGIVGGKVVSGTLFMMGNDNPSIELENRAVIFTALGLSLSPFEMLGKAVTTATDASARLLKKLEALKQIRPKFFDKLGQIKDFFHTHFPLDVPVPNSAGERLFLELIGNLGLSVSAVSWGGEFQTDTPLSFDEITPLNIAEISGSLGAFLANGGGGMYLLTNSNVFTYTVIGGSDLGVNVGLGVEIGIQEGVAVLLVN